MGRRMGEGEVEKKGKVKEKVDASQVNVENG